MRYRRLEAPNVSPVRFVMLGSAAVMAAFATAPASAQVAVQGEVIDEATDLPVRGVIVQLPDLGLATITDELGYFAFTGVTGDVQIMRAHHMGYEDLYAEAPVVAGDVLVLKLTPRPIAISGVDVRVAGGDAEDVRRTGRGSDYISRADIDEMANRTNKVLEVIRAKAPPRLMINQQGSGGVGMRFCIQSTRMRPSVQELRDLGNGCQPVLIALDGVVVFAPPSSAAHRALLSPTLPQDVAAMLLDHDPHQIESIRVLTATDAFFRYGEDGRLGAVEIKTRRPQHIR